MSELVCPACAARAPADAREHVCRCGAAFDVEHGAPRVDRALFDERPGEAGVWRFRELVDPELPAGAVVSLHEGNTPLLRSRAVAEYVGVRNLRLKHEGRNPTGSFKDRGMTVAVTRAVASGAKVLVCASTGNTAASLAAYASAAGVGSLVLAPRNATASGKLAQALAHGARTVLVRGDFDRALELVRDLIRERPELALLNSLNPFRIEGQKTIVLELLQQSAWEPPDWIVFPAGNLGNAAAFGKALREARAAGLVDRTPRLAAVQAEGAAPFARAFANGFGELEPVRAETIASAIRIGHPASYERAVRALRETSGVALAVSDDAILDAKAVVDAAGVGAEPASCAAVAGARRMIADGTASPDARIVCVLTGHLLKDPETTLDYHAGRARGIEARRPNPPAVVEPTAEALREALGPR